MNYWYVCTFRTNDEGGETWREQMAPSFVDALAIIRAISPTLVNLSLKSVLVKQVLA